MGTLANGALGKGRLFLEVGGEPEKDSAVEAESLLRKDWAPFRFSLPPLQPPCLCLVWFPFTETPAIRWLFQAFSSPSSLQTASPCSSRALTTYLLKQVQASGRRLPCSPHVGISRHFPRGSPGLLLHFIRHSAAKSPSW